MAKGAVTCEDGSGQRGTSQMIYFSRSCRWSTHLNHTTTIHIHSLTIAFPQRRYILLLNFSSFLPSLLLFSLLNKHTVPESKMENADNFQESKAKYDCLLFGSQIFTPFFLTLTSFINTLLLLFLTCFSYFQI